MEKTVVRGGDKKRLGEFVSESKFISNSTFLSKVAINHLLLLLVGKPKKNISLCLRG